MHQGARMYRFILIICLMSGWSGSSLAKTQFQKSETETGNEIVIEFPGTGYEEKLEDFKDHVPMITRHLALSQIFIESYATIFLMKEIEIFISDFKSYKKSINSEDEDSKKRIEEFKEDYAFLTVESEENLKNLSRISDILNKVIQSPPPIGIYGLEDSLTVLKKSLDHSNQCLNAEDKTIDSNLLSEIKDLCLFLNNIVEQSLFLEKSRINLSDSEICNSKTRCSKYNNLVDQIRNQLKNVVPFSVEGFKELFKQFKL